MLCWEEKIAFTGVLVFLAVSSGTRRARHITADGEDPPHGYKSISEATGNGKVAQMEGRAGTNCKDRLEMER